MVKRIGLIFPVPAQFITRIFDDKRDVFVKYLPRTTDLATTPKKILFYESHGRKEIIGEANVEKYEFLKPLEAFRRYKGRVFLNENELLEYVESQPSRTMDKKMLVLVLKGIKKFDSGIKYTQSITMAGKYLTDDEYREITLKLSVKESPGKF